VGHFYSKKIREMLEETYYIDEIFMEEASLIRNEGLIAVAIRLVHRGLQKVTLIGDSKQRAPFGSNSQREIPSALRVLLRNLAPLNQSPPFLSLQHRLPKPISDILSGVYYENRLVSATEKDVPVRECLLWIDVHGVTQREEAGSSINLQEVEAVRTYLAGLDKDHRTPTAILAPYLGQTRQIRGLAEVGPDIEVASVDGYQGRESDRVIVSLVNTERLGFLQDPKRLNVMLSRARKQLVIVGSLRFFLKQKDACAALATIAELAVKERVVLQSNKVLPTAPCCFRCDSMF
jgi:superfamily I DNA and/or RNA helicase